MIYAIDIKTEYGKQGTTGVNLMPELSENGGMAYAYSLEQALTWVKSHKLFADVEPYSLADGRFTFDSEWTEKSSALDALFGSNGSTHERQAITIYPVNTIYESTGYKPAVYTLD